MNACIYDGLRSPFGRHGGALAAVRPDDLLADVVRALVARNPFAPGAYEDLIAGCSNQAGEDARNLARHAALLAGLPTVVAGVTLNRLCGSGLASVLGAAQAVRAGEGELFIAGGAESMSRAPFVMGKAERAYDRDLRIFDSTIGSRFPNPRVEADYGADSMPQTADNVARELGISREEADRYALRSQLLFDAALKQGFYADELLPIEVPRAREAPPLAIAVDEHPRPDTSLETLARLRPLFPDGVVTAGNASGINDGAAALVIGSQAIGERCGIRPRARILAGAVAGVEPRLMGLGPVPAIQKVLQRTGLTLADMDVIEINEAFATQVLGCARQLGLAFDDSRLNWNGGAIAMGHPLGASGARLVLTATRQLEQRSGRYALVSLCIGLGQGIACILERQV
ncbi:3-oxoadipyl-CoA thiolase [Marinobacterium rhizophilum]|uniref:3-oxoadipyl-CoA thiolase n=1 Tax=Marinobacterium rhizophilum TaxID=420402 RepID=UPI0003664551|nr:3-oxoadipyl-CoA thiolase [Marinobacterium rhizophilum]